MRQSTPGTPLPSSGGGGGATPLSQPVQTPPFSALPPHLTSQVSHPGSPYSNSPSHTPSFTTPPPGVHLVSHPMVPGPFTPAVINYLSHTHKTANLRGASETYGCISTNGQEPR